MDIEFDIPAGFKPPADVQEGQEFDVVSTFRLEAGKLALVSIDGVDLPEKTETPKEESSEDDDFIGAINKGLA